MGEAVNALVQMLNPITPHICHELWAALGHTTDIESVQWPFADKAAMTESEKLIVVQVNGKVRAKITVAADATKEQIETTACAQELPIIRDKYEA